MKEAIFSKNSAIVGIVATVLMATMVIMPMQVNAAQPTAAAAAKPSSSTITDLVVANTSFDVLEAAVVRAGLAGALDGSRQYTVFAPTDQAFINALAPGKTEADAIAAVQGLPVPALQNILLYHVFSGRHISTSVLAAPSYKMLNGDRLTRTTLGNAGIAATDISARNGVVHVINSVLTPPAN